jgi:hypothetical protein
VCNVVPVRIGSDGRVLGVEISAPDLIEPAEGQPAEDDVAIAEPVIDTRSVSGVVLTGRIGTEPVVGKLWIDVRQGWKGSNAVDVLGQGTPPRKRNPVSRVRLPAERLGVRCPRVVKNDLTADVVEQAAIVSLTHRGARHSGAHGAGAAEPEILPGGKPTFPF